MHLLIIGYWIRQTKNKSLWASCSHCRITALIFNQFLKIANKSLRSEANQCSFPWATIPNCALFKDTIWWLADAWQTPTRYQAGLNICSCGGAGQRETQQATESTHSAAVICSVSLNSALSCISLCSTSVSVFATLSSLLNHNLYMRLCVFIVKISTYLQLSLQNRQSCPPACSNSIPHLYNNDQLLALASLSSYRHNSNQVSKCSSNVKIPKSLQREHELFHILHPPFH